MLIAHEIKSETRKSAYWKSFERQRLGWYRAVTRWTSKQFAAEGRDVVLAFQHDGADGAYEAADRSIAAWRKLYRTIYQSVAIEFGSEVLAGFKSAGAPETKREQDVFSQAVDEYLLTEGLKRAVGINTTTREAIRALLAESVEQGESIAQMARRIRVLFADFSRIRATRIARTEVVSASNLGSDIAALSTGLQLKKEWLTTLDGRERPAHHDVNDQMRKMVEAFDVNGEQLRFPGDSSLGATAGNIVNCRCTQTYAVDR